MKGAFSKVLSASGDEILCSPKKYLNQKKPLLEVTPTTLSVYSFQFMSAFQRIASLCRVVIQTNGYCPGTQTLTEPIALCGPLNWSVFSWDVVWWCTLGRLSRDSEIAGSFFPTVPLSGDNLGQVVYAYASVTKQCWYRSRGGDALRQCGCAGNHRFDVALAMRH